MKSLNKKEETDKVTEYLREAYKTAYMTSNYWPTRTGAVITLNDIIIEKASNKILLSHGMKEPDLIASSRRPDYEVCAEKRAIALAARHMNRTDGGVIYAPQMPCPGCAQAIVTAGLAEVVTHAEMNELCARWSPQWVKERTNVADILSANGVKLTPVRREIGTDIPIHLYGKVYHL